MTRSRRALAALVALAPALTACGSGDGGEEAVLKVFVSAPADGREADQAQRAFAAADPQGDGYRVELEVLGASGAAGVPGLVRAAANARAATSDSTAIAYVGEVEPAATRTTLPITNEARLLQVAPGPPPPDLGKFEPSGEPNFVSAASVEEAVGVALEAVADAEDPLSRESVISAADA